MMLSFPLFPADIFRNMKIVIRSYVLICRITITTENFNIAINVA